MNQSVSTYCPTTLTATTFGVFFYDSSTGKEKDSETGYHYFGARYYDSELLTGWLSVDPMADKYPNMSPYNYCAWNPVKLVDDNGEFPGATRTVLALVVGALDMGAQMASNYLSGNSLMENIDYGSVTNSFLQTFLNPKKLTKHQLSDEYDNIQKMFLFSCMTGLRYSDVQGLRWKDVKRNGKHLQLEFHQQKTDTYERLPLCAEAETLLRGMKKRGEFVFVKETNQKTNTVLKRWCKEAKIKKQVSFHIARHTFCVLLLTNVLERSARVLALEAGVKKHQRS